MHYLSVIEDAVLAFKKGDIGAIEAIDDIKGYLDVMDYSGDEKTIVEDLTKYLRTPLKSAPSRFNSPEASVGHVAGAGRGSSESEIPSAPHVECDTYAEMFDTNADTVSVADEFCESCENSPVSEWTYPECDECYQDHTD